MSVVNEVAIRYRTPPALGAASRGEGVLCGANAYTQFAAKGRRNIRCREPQSRCMKQVRRSGRALATNVGHMCCRAKDGDVESPWVKVKHWRCERLSSTYSSLPRQRRVGAAPHRGILLVNPDSREPLRNKGSRPLPVSFVGSRPRRGCFVGETWATRGGRPSDWSGERSGRRPNRSPHSQATR
ncbi:hypothetical protein SAMN05192539_103086 [Paraburkholderia diazotrophica]|uniref:Uncharacterized protein n=1 Tax=Paraburkholderia diazotrophica TaxID=667676 RepID=A0A1H7DIT2_9BURK|nr:hypothetical protein SAMN05192539_103086 [Paraburkholderia diazotrophica]